MQLLRATVLVLLVLAKSTSAVADCAKDARGGVICGQGRCVIDITGNSFCAKYRYGSVYRDLDGTIRCEGICVPALLANCTTSPAGR